MRWPRSPCPSRETTALIPVLGLLASGLPGPGVHGQVVLEDATVPLGLGGYVGASGDDHGPGGVFADLNGDGYADLYLVRAGTDGVNRLYVNTPHDLGHRRFVRAPNDGGAGDPRAATGAIAGDYDNDGDLDLFVTDWSNPDDPEETGRNDLYRNRLVETGSLAFSRTASCPAKYSWGTQWQDFDNDGRQDLHVATHGPFRDYLYANRDGHFVEIGLDAGFTDRRDMRGAMTADYDRDGWVDLCVVAVDGGRSTLLRNDSATRAGDRHFLTLHLAGDPDGPGPHRSSRDALGARVVVVADLDDSGVVTLDERQIREVVSGSSNASSTSSLAVEVGLGLADGAEVEVLWPGGRRSAWIVEADRFIRLDEATLRVGDLNASGRVDPLDIVLLLIDWGPCPGEPHLCPADLNRTGDVDFADILIMVSGWG